MTTAESQRQRLDKWLWFARVARTRSLAAALVTGGKVRVNGTRTDKTSTLVKAGDTLTIVMIEKARILVVKAFTERRGNAEFAATLYDDLTPRPPPGDAARQLVEADALRAPGSGRPTKRDRREIDRFKSRSTGGEE